MSNEKAMSKSPSSCANGRGNGTSAIFKQLLKPSLGVMSIKDVTIELKLNVTFNEKCISDNISKHMTFRWIIPDTFLTG